MCWNACPLGVIERFASWCLAHCQRHANRQQQPAGDPTPARPPSDHVGDQRSSTSAVSRPSSAAALCCWPVWRPACMSRMRAQQQRAHPTAPPPHACAQRSGGCCLGGVAACSRSRCSRALGTTPGQQTHHQRCRLGGWVPGQLVVLYLCCTQVARSARLSCSSSTESAGLRVQLCSPRPARRVCLRAGCSACEAPGRTRWQQTRRTPLAHQRRDRWGRAAGGRALRRCTAGGLGQRSAAAAAGLWREDRHGPAATQRASTAAACAAPRAGVHAAHGHPQHPTAPPAGRARAGWALAGRRAASGCRTGRSSGQQGAAAPHNTGELYTVAAARTATKAGGRFQRKHLWQRSCVQAAAAGPGRFASASRSTAMPPPPAAAGCGQRPPMPSARLINEAAAAVRSGDRPGSRHTMASFDDAAAGAVTHATARRRAACMPHLFSRRCSSSGTRASTCSAGWPSMPMRGCSATSQ